MLLGKKPIGTIAYMGGLMAVPEQFMWSYGQMIQYNADYLVEPNECVYYIRSTISFHAAARNNVVDQMKGDWLLMLDTDHVFDPDIAARMVHRMERDNLEVLTALYQHKSPPYSPVLYRHGNDAFQALGDWDKFDEQYYIPIGSSGAGCLMVKRSVFDRIKNKLKESPFDIIHPLGEDHSFFKRLYKLGIKAFCDPSIECHHLQVKPIALQDYKVEEMVLSDKYQT